jgi:hypothetical protein
MSNYSTVISDSQILEIAKVKKAHYTLILGCNGCMNESLALINRKPLMNYKKEIPYEPIFDECNRICCLLKENGVDATFEVIGWAANRFCIRDSAFEDFGISSMYMPDLVMVLSCPAGIWGIKECLSGMDVVGITKYEGVFSFTYKDDSVTKEIVDSEMVLFK